MTAPKRRPPTHADHAARLVLEHTAWWEQLPPDDHRLLAGLPAPHGPLFCWIEQQAMEQGPQPWSVVREALQGQDFAAVAIRLVEDVIPSEQAGEEQQRIELRIALEELHLAADRVEAERLAKDPASVEALREILGRLADRRRTVEELRKSLSPQAAR
ncbi:hypothetical protein OOT46_07820 [Aquabacterium sp. A7-Y]|nr:hypothetical protein [Aquabacterium sp. A7-Y]MCW7537757.1 hypothetical protein [Aquabacterium sp. A7-Y]